MRAPRSRRDETPELSANAPLIGRAAVVEDLAVRLADMTRQRDDLAGLVLDAANLMSGMLPDLARLPGEAKYRATDVVFDALADLRARATG